MSNVFCPICSQEAHIESYIRDDKQRYRIRCENKECECFPVVGREYTEYGEAERNWKKAYKFIY